MINGFMGVDPGKAGAIAVLWKGEIETVPEVHDIPYIGSEVDVWGLQALLDKLFAKGRIERMAIEKQQAFPKQGAVSTFHIGLNYGLLRGILQIRQVPLYLPAPHSWKGQMKLPKEKPIVLRRAQERWPTAGLHLAKHEGMAHALWLAEWARTQA